MINEDALEFMVLNGLLSIKTNNPTSVYDLLPPAVSEPNLPEDHPISKYHNKLISDVELCQTLGIKESEFFSYLVNHGELFNFNSY